MWNNQKQQKNCFPLCQTYKPTIILNEISKEWTNIQRALCLVPDTGWGFFDLYKQNKCNLTVKVTSTKPYQNFKTLGAVKRAVAQMHDST